MPRWIGVVPGLVSVLLAWPWWGRWTGDAVIHLVFAENAARGDWFAYNAGEISTGSSSLGFALLMGGLVRALGLLWALVAQKALLIAALVVTGWAVFSFLRTVALPPAAALFALLAVACNVGSLYHTALGMENGLFTACVALAFLTSLYLPRALERGWIPTGVSGVVVGLMALLRPEGVALVGLLGAFGLRAALQAPDRRVLWRLGAWIALMGLLVAPAILFHYGLTGQVLGEAAIRSRLMFSRRHSILLGGGLVFDPSLLARLVAWWPLTLGVLLGTRRAVAALRTGPRDGTAGQVLACVLVFWLFVLTWTFVTGIAFVPRYSMFLWPLAAVIWAYGAAGLVAAQPRWLGRAAALGLAWMLVAYAVEARFRASHLPMAREAYGLEELVTASSRRGPATDRFLARLGAPIRPARPVVVGLFEVQTRFFLDDRVRVLSMDGCTAAVRTPVRFLADGRVDEEHLLLSARPDYVLEWVQGRGPWLGFDRPAPLPSLLSRVHSELPPAGEARVAGCVLARRLPMPGFRLSYDACPATAGPVRE